MALVPSKALPARMSAARHADEEYGASAKPDWREVDWQEHLHEIELAGRRVNYVQYGSGDGPPVLLIHGLAGNWQNWLENIPELGQERRVYALDLPGFGASEMPAEDISITGYARCVHELCERLELPPAVIVGNSMGGFVAAELAIRHPERCDRLVLVAAAGISINSLSKRPTVTGARVFAAVAARTAAQSHRVVTRPRLRHLALQTVARHPTRLKPDLTWEIIQGAGKDGFLPALEALLDYDFRDRLPEIACPTLVVWGEEDMLVPVKDAREFERLIEAARCVVLEDTGHVPMLERPATFNRCLLEFLAESPASGDAERGETAAA
jgi:pimeloyl-ACP methyl ester carboxylesterase